MIPKIIHYCWFGGKSKPKEAIKCIKSWKKYCPNYEIREWNETNFDINSCVYVKEAYEQKKWAFVSDYARFWILFNYGGLYFDTDVELIKPIDDIVEKGPFMGIEDVCGELDNGYEIAVAPGLGLAANPKQSLYGEIIEKYKNLRFLDDTGKYNGKTVVHHVTELLKENGLIAQDNIQTIKGITIYPKDFFCPLDYKTGKLNITDNTRSIHWYSASWQSPISRIKTKVKNIIGEKMSNSLKKIIRKQ